MHDPIARHPTRAEQLDILVTAVAETCPRDANVLDLGCGTGYVGHLLAAKRPDLHFSGVDVSAEALDEARTHLAGFQATPALVHADLTQLAQLAPAQGSFNAIWSALTFHDLEHPAKQALIGWMAQQVSDDGFVFVYDRVRLTQAETFALQQAIWKRIEVVHGAGMRTADSYAAYVEDLDRTNRPAPLADYFSWFAQAGLTAQLLHLHGNVMLMAGARRAGAV
jgi:tRNA (cmo5U34)-methyltransferase